MEAKPLDVPAVAFDHFKLPSGRMLDDLADHRHATGEKEGQSAQRVDLAFLVNQPRVHLLGNIFQRSAGIGLEQPDVPRLDGAGHRFHILFPSLADLPPDQLLALTASLCPSTLLHAHSTMTTPPPPTT